MVVRSLVDPTRLSLKLAHGLRGVEFLALVALAGVDFRDGLIVLRGISDFSCAPVSIDYGSLRSVDGRKKRPSMGTTVRTPGMVPNEKYMAAFSAGGLLTGHALIYRRVQRRAEYVRPQVLIKRLRTRPGPQPRQHVGRNKDGNTHPLRPITHHGARRSRINCRTSMRRTAQPADIAPTPRIVARRIGQ